MTKDQEQGFEKEKICSDLLFSIQCFAYSCCAEAHDVRCVHSHLAKVGSLRTRNENYLSKYGVADVRCNGALVLMPTPTLEDGGVHIFDGRLGKLRYLALSLISASRPLLREIIHLSFTFPSRNSHTNVQTDDIKPRAPIAYPILLGHVFSHTVAAMCASCGTSRATDWKCAQGDESASDDSIFDVSESFDTVSTCENFIKLGFLARVLQVLLGILDVYSAGSIGELRNNEECIYGAVDTFLGRRPQSLACEWDERGWAFSCAALVKIALNVHISGKKDCKNGLKEEKGLPKGFNGTFSPSKIETFQDACLAARIAGESFLADASIVLQIIAPRALFLQRPLRDGLSSASDTLQGLSQWLRIESLSEMLKSTRVQNVVACWYSEAKQVWHDSTAVDIERSNIAQLLKPLPELPVFDWPLSGFETEDVEKEEVETCRAESLDVLNKFKCSQGLLTHNPQPPGTSSKHLFCEDFLHNGSICPPVHSSTFTKGEQELSPFLNNISKKCVPLIGVTFRSTLDSPKWKEICINNRVAGALVPRIERLPTSYTDLYAQLSSLLPDSEQTAVCLVCGAVLNAGGKGECTKHATCCGAGCGLFFLLQECVGLIMHGKKAAYVHSPYVDSHGETPQFRGRPLNLDLDRYDILQEMWSSHSIRQKVMTERANARQVIIAGFY